MTNSKKDFSSDSADCCKSLKQLIQTFSGVRMLCHIELHDVTQDKLYHHILKSILMYSNIEKCSLFIPDPDHTVLTCVAHQSWSDQVDRSNFRTRNHPKQFKFGEGILGTVAQTKKIYHCKNIVDDPEFVPSRGKEYTGSLICCPIIDNDKLIAVMNLHHPYPNTFHLWVENIAQSYSYIIAQLISNYHLIHHMEDQVNLQIQYLEKALSDSEDMRQRYQELSYIDYLTQCNNRRYFFSHYESMISSAIRHNEELSILLIDLDRFKRINDNHGHKFGDTVLVEVSKILRRQIRKSDLLARLGGEEFVLALHRTDLDGSMIFAERLRATIERMMWNEVEKDFVTTVSIGVSSLSLLKREENELPSTLLKEADQALYACKENGRNQCLSYTPSMTQAKSSQIISINDEKTQEKQKINNMI